MVGYLKSFHKGRDCHGGQTSYCLMCNNLHPRRTFLMVGKILLAARDIITLELRERDNNPKPQKKINIVSLL